MSRSRNLKPGFFANENLADCDPLARILFQGLWCLADREGRIEYRPRKIKAAVLPYDNCDIPTLLKQLQDRGFVIAYFCQNNQYLQVVNFSKHQSPHVKEPASIIPAPDLHQTSTSVAGAVSPSSLIPDSLFLIPDSGFPLPSSMAENSAPEGAAASPLPRPIDLKVELWSVGKRYLTHNGVGAKQAGMLLGKWRKAYGDHAVIDALAQAETCAASEPIAYIEASLRKRGTNGHAKEGPATGIARGFAAALAELETDSGADIQASHALLGRQ